MPDIVGYVGYRDAAPIVIAGLRELEYRGYDSAGIAVQAPDARLLVRKGAGTAFTVGQLLAGPPLLGGTGLGHTRWASQGRPSEVNAHPHIDCQGAIAVVHSGIIANFQGLADTLRAQGHLFRSETDTEVLPHLIEQQLQAGAPDLAAAVRAVLRDLSGAHTLVAVRAGEPGTLVAARLRGGVALVVGYGAGEMFLASNQRAILEHTRSMAFLAPDELVVLTAEGATYTDLAGRPVPKTTHAIGAAADDAARAGYRHFTQQEIYDQPEAWIRTLRGRVDVPTGGIYLQELQYSPEQLRALDRIVLVGAGSSWHSAQAGKWIFETLAGLPAEVESATEFRYRDAPLNEKTLVIAISQSGTTHDTVAALARARARGARCLGIVNVLGSPTEQLADGVICMQAGPELGVAGTKSFTCALIDQVLLALALGWARQVLPLERAQALAAALTLLPDQARRLLADDEPYGQLAPAYAQVPGFLYLGRGPLYAAALEGAHLLQQMSYVPATALPAGEVAHGARAAIDATLPVVALALHNPLYPAMLRVIAQLKAQGGNVIALATDGDERLAELADRVIYLPPT